MKKIFGALIALAFVAVAVPTFAADEAAAPAAQARRAEKKTKKAKAVKTARRRRRHPHSRRARTWSARTQPR